MKASPQARETKKKEKKKLIKQTTHTLHKYKTSKTNDDHVIMIIGCD